MFPWAQLCFCVCVCVCVTMWVCVCMHSFILSNLFWSTFILFKVCLNPNFCLKLDPSYVAVYLKSIINAAFTCGQKVNSPVSRFKSSIFSLLTVMLEKHSIAYSLGSACRAFGYDIKDRTPHRESALLTRLVTGNSRSFYHGTMQSQHTHSFFSV